MLDLGGGTFDVSILEMFDGVMEVRATAGDNFLGGEDFVDVIMDRFIAAAGAKATLPPRTQPSPIHGALRRAAELAKRALTDVDQHEISVMVDGKKVDWLLTRDEFELLSEPLLKRIRAPIERALRDSKLHPDQISHLVLAGGATRMPLIRRLAARLFQRLPIAQINPDEVVARGAAVQAGLKMRDAAPAKSAAWLHAAAAAGYPPAMYLSGLTALSSDNPDVTAAYRWFQLAYRKLPDGQERRDTAAWLDKAPITLLAPEIRARIDRELDSWQPVPVSPAAIETR